MQYLCYDYEQIMLYVEINFCSVYILKHLAMYTFNIL